MARHIDTLPRVRLTPADWERVEAMAAAESRSVANMLSVLVAEAMAARDAATLITDFETVLGVEERLARDCARADKRYERFMRRLAKGATP